MTRFDIDVDISLRTLPSVAGATKKLPGAPRASEIWGLLARDLLVIRRLRTIDDDALVTALTISPMSFGQYDPLDLVLWPFYAALMSGLVVADTARAQPTLIQYPGWRKRTRETFLRHEGSAEAGAVNPAGRTVRETIIDLVGVARRRQAGNEQRRRRARCGTAVT